MLQILQITHLPGHLERPEYECRPPCSTPQKQKVTEHVSCEGYSRVSGQWVRARRAPRGGASVARHLYSQMLHLYVTREDAVQRRAPHHLAILLAATTEAWDQPRNVNIGSVADGWMTTSLVFELCC